MDTAEALVVEALEQVEILERLDYRNFKISVKASHVPTMIRAYRMLSDRVPYPLHLGVTEAGTPFAGAIKSAVGMGSLLMDGIGDTLRVSLTADPVKEVEVAWEILKALGLRERGPVMIACPSCGRDNVGVESLAVVVEARLRDYPQAFEVAVMGCVVNGPGESKAANIGISLPGTGEAPNCPVFIDGQHATTLRGTYDELAAAFQTLVDDYVEAKYAKKAAAVAGQ